MMQQLLPRSSWYSIPKFIFSEASTTMQIHITPLVKKWWTSFIPIITSIYFGSKISKQVWWTVSQGSPSGAKDDCCASKTAQHKTITSRLASCYHHRMMHSISICVGSRIAKQVRCTVSKGSPAGAKDHCYASKTAQHKTITSSLSSYYHHRMMHSGRNPTEQDRQATARGRQFDKNYFDGGSDWNTGLAGTSK